MTPGRQRWPSHPRRSAIRRVATSPVHACCRCEPCQPRSIMTLHDGSDGRSAPIVLPREVRISSAISHQPVCNGLKCTPLNSFGCDSPRDIGRLPPLSTEPLSSSTLGRRGISRPLTYQSALVLRARNDDIRCHLPGRRAGVDIEVGEMEGPSFAAPPPLSERRRRRRTC
jgi:hypothetical protein